MKIYSQKLGTNCRVEVQCLADTKSKPASEGPLTIPGDPWSLSGQKNQILAKKLGTNPDNNGPKYPKSQIHYPDRKTGKYYSMSTNLDKYWHGAGASAASLLIFFNCQYQQYMCLKLYVDFSSASRLHQCRYMFTHVYFGEHFVFLHFFSFHSSLFNTSR